MSGFNTQPPEGGWSHRRHQGARSGSFNTQPPEGGWLRDCRAGLRFRGFNTQPPEGGWLPQHPRAPRQLCFNTQPPEGGWDVGGDGIATGGGFNTQPPEGGWLPKAKGGSNHLEFQHTAARRRLGSARSQNCRAVYVSTHSRPKAAGLMLFASRFRLPGFNTQPPEGGWR